MKHSMARSGVTLLELMVALAVIAILVALILPAVQRAREVSRRVTCTSNLKQIGGAVHAYHDTFRCFPPGGISLGSWRESRDYTTWTICILPFVEQNNLYALYDPNSTNEAPVNAAVREKHVPVFTCPSDVLSGRQGSPASGPGASVVYATGSYRAMSGRSDGQSRPNGRSWFDADNSLPKRWRGAMHHVGTDGLRTEHFGRVTDGTSNTILVGEYATLPCNGDRDFCNRATFWAYTYTSYNQSSACPECGGRTLLNSYNDCVMQGGVGGEHACKRGWASQHADGFQAVFVDGSTKFISTRIDMETFGSLATIAGNDLTGPY